MNDDKQAIVGKLQHEFAQWETVLAGLREAQITTPHAGGISLKDEIAHLWGWQQISRAHVRAAVEDTAPQYPEWPVQIVPGDEGDVNAINAWIYTTYGTHPWTHVYAEWRAGFQEFLALSAAVPAEQLFTPGEYTWLNGYRLVAVLEGSLEHHQEHREELLARLGEDRAV